MEHLEYGLAHDSRGLTWLYHMDIDFYYRSFEGLRAWCLRPWLLDRWPSFWLAHTLLPLLTSKPLLALWTSYERHSLFFLITLLTFFTKIGDFWYIYALFESLMSHGLNLLTHLLHHFICCPTIIFHHTSLFISLVLSFFFVITCLFMAWVMIFHILVHEGQSHHFPLLFHGH